MFTAIIDAAFPVFALILTGWVCAKKGLLGKASTDALNRFVIYLALPALLFRSMARVPLSELAQPGFAMGYASGVFLTCMAYVWISRKTTLESTDRVIHSLSAGYANAGFMGIPLCLIVFGEEGLVPSVIGTLMTVSVLFGVCVILIEVLRAKEGSLMPAITKVFKAILRNPLLIGPVLGVMFSASGLPMPHAMDRYIELMGSAAVPCALVAIGLFLAQNPFESHNPAVLQIVLLKLVFHPLITLVLCFWVFDVPRLWAYVAVLTAALPVGTGPFMLAQMYQRDGAVSARTILLTTVCSVLTLSILIAWIEAQKPF